MKDSLHWLEGWVDGRTFEIVGDEKENVCLCRE
jgi:hypothetical protein